MPSPRGLSGILTTVACFQEEHFWIFFWLITHGPNHRYHKCLEFGSEDSYLTSLAIVPCLNGIYCILDVNMFDLHALKIQFL